MRVENRSVELYFEGRAKRICFQAGYMCERKRGDKNVSRVGAGTTEKMELHLLRQGGLWVEQIWEGKGTLEIQV